MTQNENTNFNEDELKAPEWLNSDFFEKILRDYHKDKSVKVLSLQARPASLKGDHYASVMFRINVEYQHSGATKTKSLIIKTMPELEGMKKEILSESRIFETEIGMYAEVIPRMEKILREAGDNVTLAPLCLYHSLTPRKCLVLEDLVPEGYTTQRGRHLNFEELKAVYNKIAKWHAISYKIALEEPSYFDQYRHHVFTVQGFFDNPLMKSAQANFISMLRTQPDLVKFVPYFESYDEGFFNECTKGFDEYYNGRKANAMYVLCHGDFHSKNLMFKHDAQKQRVEDVLLHDFQFCYMGPIANDLLYAIYMMIDSDVRIKRLEELLHFYFTTFQETLSKIGFKDKMPRIIEFYQQLMDHKNFEVFLLIFFLPVWYLMMTGSDYEEILRNEEKHKQMWLQEKYVQDVRNILPKYLYKGYLES